jgi:ubiquinol-cytochrome c reductase cytochrome b subunit
MSTPAHIVPEWYFLPFYGLLRSIPNKLGGVVIMLLSILALALLPLFFSKYDMHSLSSSYDYLRILFFSLFFSNLILLGWIGGQPIEEPMYTVGQYISIFYFLHVLIILP